MQKAHAALLTAATIAVIWFVSRWWVRPPAVEYDNLKYIQLLSTAISSRNQEWLAKVEQVVEERHRDDQMSPAEHEHFKGLISLAWAGDWEQADRDCFALAEAQLSRRRSKPAESGDNHDHFHEHH